MARKKKFSWIKWVLLLAVIAGALVGWRDYTNRPKNTTPDYKTNTVTRGDVTQAVTANGQITPVKNVTVGTQVSGIVTAVLADFNSRVTNGQVVARIDPSTYEQNISQAEADLASAKAGLEFAQLNHRRAKELRADDLLSASDYDKTVVDLHQAEAIAKMREAALRKAKVDLERTTIYAPIDGVIITRNVDVGQTVAATFNTPTLFQIANDLRKMQIEAMVSEADVGDVAENQKVTFSVDAFRTREFQGIVRQVRYAPITNQNVVNYTTVVEVNNDDLKLRPGMTANASIITAQKRNALRVPSAAFNFRPPTNAIVIGLTNAHPRSGSAHSEVTRNSGKPPGMVFFAEGDGARPNRDEMRKRFESMTPEQREQFRATMRTRFGDGARPGFGGDFTGKPPDSGRSNSEGPATRTIYLLEKTTVTGKEKPVLRAVTVKAGISDGNYTEVIDGAKEGDVVVTGINLSGSMAAAAAPAGRSPFGGPFGFRPR